MELPSQGKTTEEVLGLLDEARAGDADWRGGRTFSLVYNAGDDITELQEAAYRRFLQTNALSLMAFPSLQRFEAEVLAMVADLLGGGGTAAGTMTSGGTESICMAIKTARDWARAERPHVHRPEMVLPTTAHPAFHKGAHYFDVKPVVVPAGADHRADVDATRDAMTDDTILVVGSAPHFPQGMVDPIPELAALAAERGILMHVDACLGGFMLPWLERLGHDVPPWDFRVEGVTSISADLHKYGFAAKGASTINYRDAKLRRHQFYVYADWPGGIYGSPSMAGARGGGPIAAAWAVLQYLGEEGFCRLARDTMATTRRFLDGIGAIDGLTIMGRPDMSVFAYTAEGFNVYALADAVERHGWRIDRQQRPASLHMMVSPAHKHIVEAFLADLAEAADAVRGQAPPRSGMAAMYGMLAALPDRGSVGEFVRDFIEGGYKVR